MDFDGRFIEEALTRNPAPRAVSGRWKGFEDGGAPDLPADLHLDRGAPPVAV
eukprot:CAMPEP_0172789002 /NCGR_PEP_ID=MMETSP1074-20121228/207241_1 /TAXON_ID=2916 /ORGANISM="Ceratium fusus, Strain PA161109" /LENGTH=51 /DNA_ID=CAMNT_0013626037 /DNA_START=692 /DNA_END=847 /DNA_ORIENTATION=+